MSAVFAVIPAHNESATVGAVVSQVLRHVDHVLVVDDGSRDDTGALAEAAGAEVVTLSPNRGKGTALRIGIQAAIERGAEIVVTLDADGEHDPDELPALVAALDEADLALGVRDEFRSTSRRFANGLALWWFRQLDPAIDDTICGYRAFRASVAPIIDNHATGFAYEHEVLLRAAAAGLRLRSVPVRIPQTRHGGHVTRLEMVRVARHFSRWVLPRLAELDLPVGRKATLAAGCAAGLLVTEPVMWASRRWR
ncbi:MAG: glycosyltransferase family 2 protein [Myxococcales bacterium]|nr:glycosyltransferase family 2 protein [Myxococcales bacterium]MCB9531647.1 glycosyltransferase family 2 protein [Myxococcales bacterium]MCB9534218.1 glycosyltransferase family 2 protein [Myxococcales bacterium]